MNIINASDYKDKIKFGLSGTYLFFGEEEYLKHHYLSETRRSVLGNDPDAIFRHKKISCLDFNTEQIADALTTVSMGFFEGKILCELHEIQFNSLKESEWKALLDILADAAPDVITIIYTTPDELDCGTLPKMPSKSLTRLSEYATLVNFCREGELKLSKWVARHFAAEKLSYETGVCELVVQRCGRDMFVLSNEIEKLCAYVKQGERTYIEKNDVMTVCCHNMEINAFDFSNALLDGNTDKACAILTDMKLKKEKPIYILSTVTRVVTDMYLVKTLIDGGMMDSEIAKKLKMHEYKVGLYRKSTARGRYAKLQRLLEICCDTDIKLKSSSLDDYTELDKLVIMACSR